MIESPFEIFLRVLHVMAAAIWLGLGTSLPSRVSEAFNNGQEYAKNAIKGINRSANIVLISAIVTVGTGFGLIFAAYGGFKGLPKSIHIGMGLTILAFIFSFALIRPSYNKFVNAVQNDFSQAEGFKKKYAMFSGIEHAIISVVLITMIWRTMI